MHHIAIYTESEKVTLLRSARIACKKYGISLSRAAFIMGVPKNSLITWNQINDWDFSLVNNRRIREYLRHFRMLMEHCDPGCPRDQINTVDEVLRLAGDRYEACSEYFKYLNQTEAKNWWTQIPQVNRTIYKWFQAAEAFGQKSA